MSDANLDRIEADLSAIRTITGSELPFDRQDARHTLLLGGWSLIPAIVAVVGVQSRP